MRVSPKYIIQTLSKGNKNCTKGHTSIRKRQKKYCMYSRYTSRKRVPKKRTKKRQTQVKRQGSVVTSRIKLESVVTSQIKLESVVTSQIKLEIVETSRNKLEINKAFSISDRENTLKGTTTTTSGTNRRKVISPKVRKQVVKYRGKQRYNEYN